MKNIFPEKATPEYINTHFVTNMLLHVGIEFIETGSDYLMARMPVNEKTTQTFGILHGGASVVLAESIGSIAANLVIDYEKNYCVGLEVNANHLRSIRNGFVYAKASPIHIGSSTHVWEILLTDAHNEKICISRLTMAVRNRNTHPLPDNS